MPAVCTPARAMFNRLAVPQPGASSFPASRIPARRWLAIGIAVAGVAAWGWFDVRNRAVYDPQQRGLHKTDFTVYTEAGAAFFDGRDPYMVTNLRGWGYLYPPLFAILVSPLSHLDTRDQAMIWFALSTLLALGCVYELVRVAQAVAPEAPARGAFGPLPAWLIAAGLATAALPTLNCLQRGQVGVAKLYLLLLGFRLLMERRGPLGAALAGAVLAVPVVLKITPAVPVAVVLGQELVRGWTDRRQAWTQAAPACTGNAAGLVVCVLLLPAMLVGWRANLAHLDTWWNQVAVHAERSGESDFAGDSTSARNQSLSNAAHGLGNWLHYYFAGGPHDLGPQQLRQGGSGLLMDAPWVERLLAALRALAGGLAVAVGFRMARAGDAVGQAAAFGLACTATLLVFTIARTHYFMMLLPGVTFSAWWLARHDRPRLALWLAWLPAMLVVVHYLDVGTFGRVGLLGLGISVWYLVTAAALLITPERTAAPSRNESTGARAWPKAQRRAVHCASA